IQQEPSPPSREVLSVGFSFECLVLSEIGDRKTQGVDGDKLVGNFALKNEHEIRCVKVAFDLGMVRGRVIDHVEVDSRLERRSLHIFKGDLLYFYVDLWS